MPCLDLSRPAAEVHRLVWAWRFTIPGGKLHGALAELDGETVRVLASSLTEVDGATRVECADAPLWLVKTEPAGTARGHRRCKRSDETRRSCSAVCLLGGFAGTAAAKRAPRRISHRRCRRMRWRERESRSAGRSTSPDESGNRVPFGAIGMFVRLVGRGGAMTQVTANQSAGPFSVNVARTARRHPRDPLRVAPVDRHLLPAQVAATGAVSTAGSSVNSRTLFSWTMKTVLATSQPAPKSR